MKKRLSNIKLKTKHLKKESDKKAIASKPKKRKWLKRILFSFLFLFLAGSTTVAVVLIGMYNELPNIDNPEDLLAVESSVILDRNGEVLYLLHGDENREIVQFEEISPNAINAVMAIEDDQFYEHKGYDIPAILKAVCSELGACAQARGGSTITQQFIKNTFLTNERSYERKIKEIMLSIQLEKRYSKDEIMAMYLNRISFGGNFYGIQTATEAYFGKDAIDLTVAESAILASLPQAPTKLSPYGANVYPHLDLDPATILEEGLTTEEEIYAAYPDAITGGLLGKSFKFGEGDQAVEIYVNGRANFVLARMRDLGFITTDEFELAKVEADNMVFQEYRQEIKAPHFVMYVREQLEASELSKERIEGGGLVITTTLDYNMQQIGERILAEHGGESLANNDINNGALVSVDPDTGQVLTMVGSLDYWNEEIDGNVNVTTSERQPGSSFKPIVYAAAFQSGEAAPSSVAFDIPTAFGGWNPKNYDGSFSGPVTLRQSLARSLNIPTIKAGDVAGMENVVNLARSMGVDLNNDADFYGLPGTLGTVDAKPLEMALAYSAFANGGYHVDPVVVLKIEDSDGNIVQEYKEPADNDKAVALDPEAAYLVHDVLSDVSARPGAFWQNQLNIPDHENGAKTGTSTRESLTSYTDPPQDVWTIGYTRNLSTAVWAGNSRGEELAMNANGLMVAAPIWKEFMIEAVPFVEKADFEAPNTLVWTEISKRSGRLISNKTPSGDIITAMFASYGVPTEYDDSYQLIKIDSVSEKLATEWTPEEAIVEKAFYKPQALAEKWQDQVTRWAAASGLLGTPPTEYDDVHTADTMNQPPQITIVSPQSQSTVSPPSISVVAEVESAAGVDRVDYYFDGQFITSLTSPPYNTTISLSGLADGSTHTIMAKIYDPLLRSNQSSVTVKIGEDEVPPTVSFAYPSNNAQLISGASVNVSVDAFDSNGSIGTIKYYLNGALKKTENGEATGWQMTVPPPGDHDLSVQVTDLQGNTTTSAISFESTIENDGGASSGITSPGDYSTFEENKNINVAGYVSAADRQGISAVTFIAKKSGQISQEIGSVAGSPGSANYSITWNSPPAGTYEVYMKISMTNGNTRFTGRVPVVVGNAVAEDVEVEDIEVEEEPDEEPVEEVVDNPPEEE